MEGPPPRVREWYRGKIVLVTGATGFVGKVVAEKLLREVPDVGRIYLLVRPKKKSTPSQRFSELLQSSIFDTLRAKLGAAFEAYARERMECVSGDLVEENMGLSEGDWKRLTETVHVILHNAATILFNEPLDEAVMNNTFGALNVLNLAKNCSSLKMMVHCSTAYVNAPLQTPTMTREEVYPTREVTDDPEALFAELLATDPLLLAKRCPTILGRFPNTYTFTKNLTEQLLERRRGNTPVCIVRPSIVTCTYNDPIRGWIDNLNAAGAYYLMGSLGALRYLWGRSTLTSDMVPVDYVSNAAIVAAMYCSKLFGDQLARQEAPEMHVFHVATSHRNPITYGKVRTMVEEYSNSHPAPNVLRPCIFGSDMHFMEHKWTYYPAYYLNERLPAVLYSAFARSPLGNATHRKNAEKLNKGSGNEQPAAPTSSSTASASARAASHRSHTRCMAASSAATLDVRSVQEKSLIVAQTFRFFVSNEWVFTTTKLLKMYASLHLDDRRDFDFDPAHIDWHTNCRAMTWGLRRFVTNETTLVHPDEERFSRMYFDRRTFQVTADLLWAYQTHPRGTIAPSAPQLVVDRTLHSDRVKRAIEQLSKEHGTSVEQLKGEARQILDQMAGQLYGPVLRTLAYFFRKVYKNLYDAVIVDELGLKRLRDMRATASKLTPLVLIPTHRSYIDFLMLSFLLFAYELPLPQIAAGDDFLDMAGVNWIFRHSGAFFLKRSFRNDLLYRSIFEEYVQQLLFHGHTLEFFIEGTRSRTGKNLPPKTGLLNMATDPYFEGKLEDMHIVPVFIGYEKMVEEENHARQLTGEARGSFSTKALLAATYDRVIGHSFGRINIQFSEPIQLSSYVQEFSTAAATSAGAPFDPKVNTTQRRQLTSGLAYQVLHSFQQDAVVMSTGIVASIILAFRNGIDKETLVEKYTWLETQIQARGGRVDPLSRTMQPLAIVNRAMALLGRRIVQERRSFVEPVIDSRESHRVLLQLSLYRNQVPHVFFAEAVVLVVLAATKGRPSGVPVAEVMERAEFVKTVLTVEFHTAADSANSQDWPATIAKLRQRGLITLDEMSNTVALAEDDADKCAYFLCTLLWPFLDAHWVAILALYSLLPNRKITEELLISQMQWFAEKLFFDGVILHFDACSKESMRCAVTVLVKHLKVLKVDETDKLFLDAALGNDAALERLCDNVGQYRRGNSKSCPGRDFVMARFPLLAKL